MVCSIEEKKEGKKERGRTGEEKKKENHEKYVTIRLKYKKSNGLKKLFHDEKYA